MSFARGGRRNPPHERPYIPPHERRRREQQRAKEQNSDNNQFGILPWFRTHERTYVLFQISLSFFKLDIKIDPIRGKKKTTDPSGVHCALRELKEETAYLLDLTTNNESLVEQLNTVESSGLWYLELRGTEVYKICEDYDIARNRWSSQAGVNETLGLVWVPTDISGDNFIVGDHKFPLASQTNGIVKSYDFRNLGSHKNEPFVYLKRVVANDTPQFIIEDIVEPKLVSPDIFSVDTTPNKKYVEQLLKKKYQEYPNDFERDYKDVLRLRYPNCTYNELRAKFLATEADIDQITDHVKGLQVSND